MHVVYCVYVQSLCVVVNVAGGRCEGVHWDWRLGTRLGWSDMSVTEAQDVRQETVYVTCLTRSNNPSIAT